LKIKKKFIVAIDQGTTSSRAVLFDTTGKSLFKSQLEFRQYFPKNGWVEHNPEEILSNSGEIGKLELEIFKFNVKSLQSYEKDLILVK